MAEQKKESTSSTNASQSSQYYLMKAEPDSRVVKGKDVKFSVDDFEKAKVTAWEGVRNYTARNTMQDMKIGQRVLFYHSNTKEPGIAGFAEVCREAYPDHTAWDKDHPYYDAKSDSSSPRWYMVDLRFNERSPHFVSLALLKHLGSLSQPPSKLPYLTADDLKALKGMELLSKGRLSVQKVEEAAWNAVSKIAKNGDEGYEWGKANKIKAKAKTKAKEQSGDDEEEEEEPKVKRKSPADRKGEEAKRKSKRAKK